MGLRAFTKRSVGIAKAVKKACHRIVATTPTLSSRAHSDDRLQRFAHQDPLGLRQVSEGYQYEYTPSYESSRRRKRSRSVVEAAPSTPTPEPKFSTLTSAEQDISAIYTRANHWQVLDGQSKQQFVISDPSMSDASDVFVSLKPQSGQQLDAIPEETAEPQPETENASITSQSSNSATAACDSQSIPAKESTITPPCNSQITPPKPSVIKWVDSELTHSKSLLVTSTTTTHKLDDNTIPWYKAARRCNSFEDLPGEETFTVLKNAAQHRSAPPNEEDYEDIDVVDTSGDWKIYNRITCEVADNQEQGPRSEYVRKKREFIEEGQGKSGLERSLSDTQARDPLRFAAAIKIANAAAAVRLLNSMVSLQVQDAPTINEPDEVELQNFKGKQPLRDPGPSMSQIARTPARQLDQNTIMNAMEAIEEGYEELVQLGIQHLVKDFAPPPSQDWFIMQRRLFAQFHKEKMSNRKELIELQEQYITLIDSSGDEITNLKDELNIAQGDNLILSRRLQDTVATQVDESKIWSAKLQSLTSGVAEITSRTVTDNQAVLQALEGLKTVVLRGTAATSTHNDTGTQTTEAFPEYLVPDLDLVNYRVSRLEEQICDVFRQRREIGPAEPEPSLWLPAHLREEGSVSAASDSIVPSHSKGSISAASDITVVHNSAHSEGSVSVASDITVIHSPSYSEGSVSAASDDITADYDTTANDNTTVSNDTTTSDNTTADTATSDQPPPLPLTIKARTAAVELSAISTKQSIESLRIIVAELSARIAELEAVSESSPALDRPPNPTITIEQVEEVGNDSSTATTAIATLPIEKIVKKSTQRPTTSHTESIFTANSTETSHSAPTLESPLEIVIKTSHPKPALEPPVEDVTKATLDDTSDIDTVTITQTNTEVIDVSDMHGDASFESSIAKEQENITRPTSKDKSFTVDGQQKSDFKFAFQSSKEMAFTQSSACTATKELLPFRGSSPVKTLSLQKAMPVPPPRRVLMMDVELRETPISVSDEASPAVSEAFTIAAPSNASKIVAAFNSKTEAQFNTKTAFVAQPSSGVVTAFNTESASATNAAVNALSTPDAETATDSRATSTAQGITDSTTQYGKRHEENQQKKARAVKARAAKAHAAETAGNTTEEPLQRGVRYEQNLKKREREKAKKAAQKAEKAAQKAEKAAQKAGQKLIEHTTEEETSDL